MRVCNIMVDCRLASTIDGADQFHLWLFSRVPCENIITFWALGQRNQGAFKAAETAQMSNNREVRDKDSKCTFSHHNLRSIDSLPNRCSHRLATFTDGFLSFVPEALYLHLHLTSRNGQEMNCAKVFITVKCDIRVCFSFSLLNWV